ncbi:MAG: hypothetical protein RRZ32_00410 [Acinetobacter sp.]
MELQVLEQNSNVIVEAYKTEGGAQSLFDQIAVQARSVVPDLSTDKKRKEIASMAAKVSKTKVAFDNHGKTLKEQYTVITNKIDADRKLFRDQCDALRDEIRQPLTNWENAEKDRVEKHKSDIEKIRDFAHPSVLLDMSADRIAEQIRMLDVLEICPLFEEYEDQAKLAKLETLETLRSALNERAKYEADQAELERLRQADLTRQQQERDAQIAHEAAEKATHEAEEKARFEAERVQREKTESDQREARLRAEKEAAELREQALKQKAIDDAKQAEITKQQAIEAERKRIEAEQAAKAQAEIDANAAREADQAHKKIICGAALKGLTDLGVDEAIGRMILNAINKGLVPHVSIKF